MTEPYTVETNMSEGLKRGLALGMVVVAAVAILLVFGTPGGGSRPLVPSLTPLFGVEFGALLLIAQVLYCYYFNVRKGFVLILVVWVIAIPLVYIGGAFRFSSLALEGSDRMISGASSLSALVIGFRVLKGRSRW